MEKNKISNDTFENNQTQNVKTEKGPPKKFMNGWTKEQEKLMARWSDIATCYRWLHDRSEKYYSRYNILMTIPVIILSTLTGTANFGMDSFFDSNQERKYASIAIGGLSLVAGMLTTLGNFFRFAQLMESHRVAAISWGKFQRQVAIELALHPNDRIICMDFLKICRNELDRMIEQAPPIPDDVINSFESQFKNIKDVNKPDICNSLEPTHIFVDTDGRLKQLAVEASMMIQRKKQTLKDLVEHDLETKIVRDIDQKIIDRIADHYSKILTEKEKEEQELHKTKTAFGNITRNDLETMFREDNSYTYNMRTTETPRNTINTPNNLNINDTKDSIIIVNKDDVM
jgi:hypothetical protein